MHVGEGCAYVTASRTSPAGSALARLVRRVRRGRSGADAVRVEARTGADPVVSVGRRSGAAFDGSARGRAGKGPDAGAALDLGREEAARVVAELTAAARLAVHAHDTALDVATTRGLVRDAADKVEEARAYARSARDDIDALDARAVAGEGEAGHLVDHLRGHAARAQDHARVAAHLLQGALRRTEDAVTHQEAADVRSRLHEVTSHADQAADASAQVAQSVTAYAAQADDGPVCRACLDPGCDGDHGEGA